MKYAILAIILSIIVLLTPTAQPSGPRYAAPYGSGDGTPDDPMSLSSALVAGGEIWLLPGIYTGMVSIGVDGTTLRSVPGTRARIDGDMEIHADDVTIRDLEITNTSWLTRTSAYPNAPVPDLPQSGTTIDVIGKRTRILHNYIHDLGLAGIGPFSAAIDTEIAYNLVYNNGWQGSDRGHAPAIYAQNQHGEKWIHDNVLLPGYNEKTFEIYGSSAAYVRNFRIERNIHIGGKYLIGTQGSAVDRTDALTITDNLLWGVAMEVGYTNKKNGRAIVNNNYLGMSRLQADYFRDFQASGNTIINAVPGETLITLQPPITATLTTNTYYRTGAGSPFVINGVSFYSWPSWQAAGYDSGSTYTSALPTQNAIFVRSWGVHRGVVVVYNWEGLTSVTPDLSALSLTPGATYKLVNAQNPSEVLPFTAGSPVSIPMTGWTVAAPYAASAPLGVFDPRFACFLVEPGL